MQGILWGIILLGSELDNYRNKVTMKIFLDHILNILPIYLFLDYFNLLPIIFVSENNFFLSSLIAQLWYINNCFYFIEYISILP